MFDIGWSEFVVIAVVALIAIGPKELPGVLRSVGYWMGKVRRMAAEFQGQFQEAMREAEMADLKKHADDLNNMAKGVSSGLTSHFDPFDTASESQTVKSPAPLTAAAGEPTAVDTTNAAGAAAGAAVAEASPVPTPDFSQVAAMPDIVPAAVAPAAPETVPAVPPDPPQPAPPMRRDA
jgi:sec-independent protein translocase protein TatB